MQDTPSHRAALLAHHRIQTLEKGEPVTLPLIQSSVYQLPGNPQEPAGAHTYGRAGNETWEGVEASLSLLEGAKALAFPSGMAAISAAMLSQLKSGDHLILPSDGYYATRAFAERFLTPLGITMSYHPTVEIINADFAKAAMIFIESPSNPNLDICDIKAIAQKAHDNGALLVIDNTTMTPLGQSPLDHGADIVVAADTKAPSGHSDVLFGHLASHNEEIINSVYQWRSLSGAIPGPHEAWLVNRGLETLDVRFARMCDNAGEIARRLAVHPAVEAIRYPGLETDPSYALARAQMHRFGFLIAITLASEHTSEHFINACPMIAATTSFGGVHTSAERRARWGDDVAPSFIRLSIGCEPLEELWAAMLLTLDEL